MAYASRCLAACFAAVLFLCSLPGTSAAEVQVSLEASEAVSWMDGTAQFIEDAQALYKNMSVMLISDTELSRVFADVMKTRRSEEAFNVILDRMGKDFLEINEDIISRTNIRNLIWIYPTAHGIIYSNHEDRTGSVQKAFEDYGFFFYILEMEIPGPSSLGTNTLLRTAYEKLKKKYPSFQYLEDDGVFVLRIYPMISSLPVILGKTIELESLKRNEMTNQK